MSQSTPAIDDASAAPSVSFAHRAAHFGERFALLGLAILTAGFFSVFPPSAALYLTIGNANVMLGSQSVTALLALAALFTLISGHFDFSLGSNAAFSSVIAASMMSFFALPLWLAIVTAVALGGLIGFLNGLFVARFKMDAFVATLGMATLLGGLILWITGGATIFTGIDRTLPAFGSQTFLGLPLAIYVVAIVAVVAWFFLEHTRFGRTLYAIGANPHAARLVGMRVDRQTHVGFVISGLLSGVAGIIFLARAGSATADPGTGLIFPALAAVFLGATAVRPGFFNVLGTIIGVIFVSLAVSGLTLSGATSWASPVFNGFALIVAVALSTYLGRRRRRSN